MDRKLVFNFLKQPGLYWSRSVLASQVEEMRAVAATCLDEVPYYQCLSGDRNSLARNIIVQAREKKTGKLVAFCSAVLFDLDDEEKVLHLGLTCVSPEYRGKKLTHQLTSRIIKGYFFNYSLFKTLWVTNVACVISSLGNVAKYFEQVFPSPFLSHPKRKHLEIAKLVSSTYRKDFYVGEDIKFNPISFVFEGSVGGNTFQKEETDSRYFHRDLYINDFYQRLLNFKRGDEVLQVGKVSIFTFLKYLLKNKFKRTVNIKEFFELEDYASF